MNQMNHRPKQSANRRGLEAMQLFVHKHWELYLWIVGGTAGLAIGTLAALSTGEKHFIALFPLLGVIAVYILQLYSGMFWGGFVLCFFAATVVGESEAWYGVGSLLSIKIVLEVSQYMFRSPLHSATKRSDLERMERLIIHGADVNELYDGAAPLHIAADVGNRNVVELLLSKGADLEIRSRHESTPLLSAVFKGHQEIVEILVQRGAKTCVKNVAGQTALHMAAYGGYTELVKSLLSFGVEASAKTQADMTAADVAEQQGHKELAQILRIGQLVPKKE